MVDKRYTSGEIASAAGLTIRAVQHYDNIDLLPSSGRTEGGRRFYTQNDLIRLEQIVFYKSLAFSLDEIKDRLLLKPSTKELLEMFKNQQLLLLERMEQLHTSFATIGIVSSMVEAGKEPPIHLLINFLRVLPGDDIFSKVPQMLTNEQHQSLSLHFQEIEPIQIFFHKWKEILLEATILLHENTSPESASAQDLAKRWWETILSITGGNLELIKEISELNLDSQISISNEPMIISANRFLDSAFNVYASVNELHLDLDYSC